MRAGAGFRRPLGGFQPQHERGTKALRLVRVDFQLHALRLEVPV